MKSAAYVLRDGSISFEVRTRVKTGDWSGSKVDYMIVKQVHNHGDQTTNGSNNVGGWVVKSSTVKVGFECNDLAYLLNAFTKAVRDQRATDRSN